jgi:nucleoside-diphosphate-sugar epimerase
MMGKFYLVTGGTGFLGSALVRRLIQDGHRVRVLDNNSRGSLERLKEVAGAFEFVKADIRDADAVQQACRDVDSVCHLAYINGTEFFYTKPELVLEVAVVGMVNVLNGCRRAGVKELVLASSSEVYQTPPVIPTDETVPLSVPDPLTPRYSYGGGKIISELLAINYGRAYFERVLIFRPHNVYGPDMGWEHVVPQFVLRMRELCQKPDNPVRFPIQGTGAETRSFVFIDDFIDGLALVLARGEHLGIYNIGTDEEITIAAVAKEVGRYFGREVEILPGKPQPGSALRRCPDITKLRRLGYAPRVPFRDGLPIAARWYDENAHRRPASVLMEN